MTYPTEQQYARWKREADDHGMSVSEFIQSMTEAGLKKVDEVEVEPDETRQELRADRNRLQNELEQARETIRYLEEQTNTTERQEILDFLVENPGADYDDIVNYVIGTAPERIADHLDALGDELRVEESRYYPVEETEA
jgi:hypothetical protein